MLRKRNMQSVQIRKPFVPQFSGTPEDSVLAMPRLAESRQNLGHTIPSYEIRVHPVFVEKRPGTADPKDPCACRVENLHDCPRFDENSPLRLIVKSPFQRAHVKVDHFHHRHYRSPPDRAQLKIIRSNHTPLWWKCGAERTDC